MATADVRSWFTRIARYHCYAHSEEQRAEMIKEMIGVVKAEVAEKLNRVKAVAKDGTAKRHGSKPVGRRAESKKR